MRINVHIERLIVDGLPLRKSEGTLVQLAVERELAHLLAGNGLNSDLVTGGAVASLPASSIQLAKNAPPARLGQQIAGAVQSRIGGEPGNSNAD